ncbi:MAG: hypothetical protein ACM3X0_03885 [Bacteroidota bacterium]
MTTISRKAWRTEVFNRQFALGEVIGMTTKMPKLICESGTGAKELRRKEGLDRLLKKETTPHKAAIYSLKKAIF